MVIVWLTVRGNPMSNMINPLDGLLELQDGINNGLQMVKCPGDSGISVFFDNPEGVLRLTYAMMEGDTVVAYSVFLKDKPINGVAVFDVGYAVLEEYRGKGMASHVLKNSIDFLTNTMKSANAFTSYYIEAIIGVNNTASNKLAHKVISDKPKQIVDMHSGEDAYQYLRLINF